MEESLAAIIISIIMAAIAYATWRMAEARRSSKHNQQHRTGE